MLLHLVVNVLTPYGVHRDELLYMAMGQHLRLWRMDFPPGIALVSIFERGLFGDSLLAIRLLPALGAGGLALLSAAIALELGGTHRFAQWVAALLTVISPFALRSANLLQPVIFDELWWTLGLYALVRLSSDERPDARRRWWIAYGIACGIGLLFKFSILFFGFATLLALLATPRRRDLATPWPWLAFLIAFALGSPSIVGQIRLGWPVAGQMADLQRSQLAYVSYASFAAAQPLLMGAGTLVAVPGLIALVAANEWRRFRIVGWTCAFAFLTLLVLRGKAYYIGPIYPTLFAAGSVLICHLALERGGLPVRWGVLTVAVLFTAVVLPVGVPILGPEAMERYERRIGVGMAMRNNQGGAERLPQDYEDMLGWEDQAAAVGGVYRALPPDDKARAVVIGTNYGEAGALDFYGPRYGLPPVVSAAGSYWFFGPGDKPGDVAVILGDTRESLDRFFESCSEEARVQRPYGVESERDVAVWVCRWPKESLQVLWPSLAGQN